MQKASTRVIKGTQVRVSGDVSMPIIAGAFGATAERLEQLYGTVVAMESGKVDGNLVIDQRFLHGWHWTDEAEPRFELEISAHVRGDIEFATRRFANDVNGRLSVFVQKMINGSLLIGDHTSTGNADKSVYINSALSIPLAVEFFGQSNNVAGFDLVVGPESSTISSKEENAHLYLWDREVNGVRYVRVFGVDPIEPRHLGSQL